MTTRLVPLFSLLALAALAWAPARADLLVKDGQKVAFLGDSITQYGWQRPGGYVRLVVSGLETLGVKVTPIPAGVSGNTSRDMLGRLAGSVLNAQPDWMTLSCGVNDVWHGASGVDLETYKKNIASIVDQAQAKGIRPLILTATVIQENLSDPNNVKLAAYNDYLRQLAKERNLPLADLNAAFQAAIQAAAPGSHLTVDGVHMNPYGNRLMAEGVLRAFGATDGQIAAVKKVWDQAPDAAALVAQAAVTAAAPVSIQGYEAFTRIAGERKVNPAQLQSNLLLKAWAEVAKAHAQDDSLDMAALQPEIEREFARQVAALLSQAAPKTSP